MIEKLNSVKSSPSRILRTIIEEQEKDFTYIILGASGRSGKTWLCNGLRQYGYNAFEISEHTNAFVQYNDSNNHIAIDKTNKQVIIFLNKRY